MDFTIEELSTIKHALEYAIEKRSLDLSMVAKAGIECDTLVRNMYEEGKLYKKLKDYHGR